ncbi:hypothetical protein FQR65_LT20251 [Abscondita terminalis]|nr:hypothetical protein FQR65_LT20251 [Abscondita terminalis]
MPPDRPRPVRPVGDARKQNETQCETEEAYEECASIMPFIKELGYDVSIPADVTPGNWWRTSYEAEAKKSDYAILKNGEPIILIGASTTPDLELHNDRNCSDIFILRRPNFRSYKRHRIPFYTDLVDRTKR